MADDVVLNKVAIIERCLGRVREEYAGDDQNLFENLTRQDSILLNLQRACEAAIDLGMHLVRVQRLGVPQESRDAFRLLSQAGSLPPELSAKLEKMVGFRNIAIHDYRAIDLDIVRSIVRERLEDFFLFTSWALQQG
jgi:uncharacterized protein YutE (UPF0331/DUF86 family)